MLEPTPILLAFLIFKRFIFLELVAALALARAMRAAGPSRGAAVVALVLAVFGAIVLLAPVAGLTGGAVVAVGADALAADLCLGLRGGSQWDDHVGAARWLFWP